MPELKPPWLDLVELLSQGRWYELEEEMKEFGVSQLESDFKVCCRYAINCRATLVEGHGHNTLSWGTHTFMILLHPSYGQKSTSIIYPPIDNTCIYS